MTCFRCGFIACKCEIQKQLPSFTSTPKCDAALERITREKARGAGILTLQARKNIMGDLRSRFDNVNLALASDNMGDVEAHINSLCLQLGVVRHLVENVRKVAPCGSV